MWLLAEDHPSADPVVNLALEEALVRGGPAGPVLRVWRAGRCVVLGRGQRAAREALLVTTPAADIRYLAPHPQTRTPWTRTAPRSARCATWTPYRSGGRHPRGARGDRAAARAAARPPAYPAEVDRLSDLLARRYRNPTWHQSARTEEATWTSRPALSSTG